MAGIKITQIILLLLIQHIKKDLECYLAISIHTLAMTIYTRRVREINPVLYGK